MPGERACEKRNVKSRRDLFSGLCCFDVGADGGEYINWPFALAHFEHRDSPGRPGLGSASG